MERFYKGIIQILALSVLGVMVTSVPGNAQQEPQEPMLLWPQGASNAKGDSTIDKPDMTVFLPEASEATGTGVVIFPGGGYQHLAMDKEGYKVAHWLNELGVAAFVVKYRLGPRYNHPSQINDAQRAIKMVRANAAEWGIDKDRLGILGFSAGGHLTSTAGTHFDQGNSGASDAIDRQSSRPNFMVLIYPVVTMKMDYTHQGSRRNLLGPNPDQELVDNLSNELQVSDQTPPTFIIHGTNDTAVPVQNSLQFYEALLEHDVPAEMHLFRNGPHGFGLSTYDPELSIWTELCENWMRDLGFLN